MTQETVNVAEIFQMMPARFNKEAAEGIEAIYQFELTGQGGGRTRSGSRTEGATS